MEQFKAAANLWSSAMFVVLTLVMILDWLVFRTRYIDPAWAAYATASLLFIRHPVKS